MEDRKQDLLEQDVDIADDYDSQWYSLEQWVEELEVQTKTQCNMNKAGGSAGECDCKFSINNARRLRLPKLDLPKFNSEIKTWLCPFGHNSR